jgi:hypothetical protein
MGVFLGPARRCCEAMDYVVVRTEGRYTTVCIACDHVFCDYDPFEPNGPRNTAYLRVVKLLKELLG